MDADRPGLARQVFSPGHGTSIPPAGLGAGASDDMKPKTIAVALLLVAAVACGSAGAESTGESIDNAPCATHGGVQVTTAPARAKNSDGDIITVQVVGCTDGTQESHSTDDPPNMWRQVP
jgi:hypothetical protein